MNVKEIYDRLCQVMPESLREEWDNDGIMCAPDGSLEVKRALVTLDVTENIVDYAIAHRFDLILSHHPLIFKPIGSVSEDTHVARKLIKLIRNGISVISLHTRADKVSGGVNDILCDILKLENVESFGEGGIGRIGTLSEEATMEDFSYLLKGLLDCDGVKVADACIPVQRVALVGGDGKDFVNDALHAGADTFVSGRISYNMMVEAEEMGMNMLEAGHFFTEFPVCSYFQSLLIRFDRDMYVEIASSNAIRLI